MNIFNFLSICVSVCVLGAGLLMMGFSLVLFRDVYEAWISKR